MLINCLANSRWGNGNLYAYPRGNFHNMRHIIAVLIALLVLLPLIFAAGAQTTTTSSSTSTTAASTAQLAPVSPKSVSQVLPAETGLDTTQSIASFLNYSWVPPGAVPAQTLVGTNGTLANATAAQAAQAQFIANSNLQNSYQSPVNVAEAANKNGVRQQSGYAILDFLNDSWTPGIAANQAQAVDLNSAGYTMHQMS
jgi:hypothetical protein